MSPSLRWCRVVSVLLAGIAFSAIPSTLYSQAQATSGIIRGTVLDNDGRAIAGATIIVRHIETNQSRSVSTNRQGAYVATLLRVGTYDVAVRFIGYQSSRRDGIAVSLGRASLVNFRLNASAVELEEIIVVAADPPPI